ncbi:PPE domain-containing protein [Lentzea sp. NPDC003310]|uniref:PPE domain-containing protein n=1 Tax=Lentzea sp. NPDC003310 TaxID=3154447 RepID=UPI0033AD090E
MTRPAPSCFTEDNSRAEGLSGAEIYSQMHGGPGTGSAQIAATAAKELERGYATIEARLKKVGETLGEAWSGASADAAQAAANPINRAMIQMQDALRQADHSISNQIYQFNLNKNQLKNVPAAKPETNLWDDATPWDTDTEDKVNQFNSEQEYNRRVYKEFQSASNTNRGELPKEFPGVMTDTLVVEIANTGGDNGEDKTANTTTSRSTGTPSTSSSTGTPQTSVGTPWTAPTTHGDQATTTPSWSDTSNNTNTSNTNNTGRPEHLTGKQPVGSVIDRPQNTGLPPIGVPVRPTTSGPTGPGGGGRGIGGPGSGAGGGKFGGGAGGAGKFGGGLSGVGGTGSGTAAQQPGGKAGVFGGMGETAAGGRGGQAAGAQGRAGAAGMGGMGGHGAKGQGEDDLEHKSADYLITEENTNEIIGDMPMVAPPTIGG